MKPGYKTTEFWIMLLVQVVAMLTVSGVFAEGSAAAKIVAMVASVLSAMGYTAARTSAKNNSNTPPTA